MDRKKCKGCDHWRKASPTSGTGMKVCHCYLDTGKRRVEVAGECKSRKTREGEGNEIGGVVEQG